MSEKISGIAASAGIAIAKAFILENPELTIEKKLVEDTASEINRFSAAVEKAKGELQIIKENALRDLGEDKAAIFAAHLLVLEDQSLLMQ